MVNSMFAFLYILIKILPMCHIRVQLLSSLLWSTLVQAMACSKWGHSFAETNDGPNMWSFIRPQWVIIANMNLIVWTHYLRSSMPCKSACIQNITKNNFKTLFNSVQKVFRENVCFFITKSFLNYSFFHLHLLYQPYLGLCQAHNTWT